MDSTVTAIGNVVVAALEDAGYMHSTIGQVRKSIKWMGGVPMFFVKGLEGLSSSFSSH